MPKAQFPMTAGHCTLQLGSGGAVSHTVDPGQSPGGGTGGETPRNTEDLHFMLPKIYKKITFYEPLPLHFSLFFING